MKKQNKTMENKGENISRRDFLGGAAAAAAFTIVPRHVLGGNGNTPPSEKLNIAGVGIGGMGRNNIKACESENIVALCDVDDKYAADVYKKYPQAAKYHDFRRMLDKQKDIDAVIVATPDHTHAVVAMAAIQRSKHVYVQKPLTYTIKEARMLTEAARKYKVATQMGNQGHSGEGIRLVKEWIQAGAIGDVREVNCWTNRPVWPQGAEMDRPADTPPVPATLDWDLWLGPAPKRPYHPCYLPSIWRRWWDFGTGSLGDMGCHIMDPPFWALDLGYPVSVEGSCSTYWDSMWGNIIIKNEIFPRSSVVRYKFPARKGMPPVTMTWHDGGLMPEIPEELDQGGRMGDSDGGNLFIGDKGKIICGCYGSSPRLIPESKMQEFLPNRPPKTIPRIEGSHEQDWVRACKGGPAASSNFDYSGPLTETVLFGNLAPRFPGRKLLWDGANMKVTNEPEANQFIHRQYRQGWSL